jgi:HEAT repeat protein
MSLGRPIIALAVFLTLVILLFATVCAPDQPDPQYQGKPFSSCLPSLEEQYGTYGLTTNFDTAIEQLGDKAIPVLLRMLRENTPVKDELSELLKKQKLLSITHSRSHLRNHLAARGFEILGAAGKEAVPALVQILEQNISASSRAATAEALGNIGPPAEEAIPSLLRVLDGQRAYEKCWSCYALAKIHRNPQQVVPALMKSALGPDCNVRAAAIAALGKLGSDAKLAVPVLVESLKDPDKAVSRAATKALAAVDLVTAQRIGLTTNGLRR